MSLLAPLLLGGPTASGKSAVALALAARINGELISVDSMQVYRGLDIGTAKPSAQERAAVRHHLIDVAELNEGFDAARFVHLATSAVTEIQSRGRVPIFCGGTGLYFNAFLDGLGAAPPSDSKLRAELEATPLSELVKELACCDRVTFDRIDLENRRRVVRAVEVTRLTGRPFSLQRSEWAKRVPTPPVRAFGLTRPREGLIRRIDHRVDTMFNHGLIDETRQLLQAGLESNRTAMQAIGYRQVVEHLQGIRGRLETIELVKVRTRQFARRQGNWFRGQLNLRWLVVGADDSPEAIAQEIIQSPDYQMGT